MSRTPLEDAEDFKKVMDDPAVNGYTSIRVLHPVINGYVSLHRDRMPWRVRIFALVRGVIPESYTRNM